MGLHAFTKPDPENGGFIIRFGWLCDVCGKEIKDPRDGSIDYTCLDPGEAKSNKRYNKVFGEDRPEEDFLDYIVYHTTTCCPKKRHRYWDYLHKVVHLFKSSLDESPQEGTVTSGRCVYGTTQDSYDIHGRRVRLCDCRSFDWGGF